ncbi:MAG: FAD-dependent monooxygenase [Rubrivivax sp.]
MQVAFAHRDGGSDWISADAAVGADGIHSVVAPAVFAAAAEADPGAAMPTAPRFSGLCAFRFLVPAAEAPAMALRPVQTLRLGPGRHLVHYPISSGRLVNVVAIVPAGHWRTESWTAEGRAEDVAAEFAAGTTTQLIAAAREVKRWAMYDRDPLPRWTSGRVTLLGDAAHAMLPFFAQGAAQAIEDAEVLAQCLRGADVASMPAALARYEALRRPRASEVQLMSRGREYRNHLPDGPEQERRDAELRQRRPAQAAPAVRARAAAGA